MNTSIYRKTSQELAPLTHRPLDKGQYDIYPGFPLPAGQIFAGFESLAQALTGQHTVVIDGYGGVLWEDFRQRLEQALRHFGRRAVWQDVGRAFLPQVELEARLAPFLGGSDPIFGRRFQGSLADFFDPAALPMLQPEAGADLNILYGCGAALAGWEGLLIYVDIPKNEIQFRSRAGVFSNLGWTAPKPAKEMYKQLYFVDWAALNQHKARLLPQIDLMVDGQRAETPVWLRGDALRAGLAKMSRSHFRVRPWFEPGPWGGQWIKEHISQLPKNVPNYAWSFELITPENGLMFESDGLLLEVSFDCLMFQAAQEVLGKFADRFGYEFPIRYDFLDTFEGGNLSIQCHPRPEYIASQFGENFTQDEAYYILDARPGARVYLGFQAGIDPPAFRAELERSFQQKAALDMTRFVNSEPSAKHDLFLIPNGTIHGAGVNNLVLEISATPYIFTFKMYDWMRLDLDGQPRPLNIGRAFDNLYFERQGANVQQELIAHPRLLAEGDDWQVYHLPTHPAHFYDVHRLEFARQIEVTLDGSPHVLSLVEGEWVVVETEAGMRQQFNYAETFVIPAAAGHYRLLNETGRPLKVVKTFLKAEAA